VVLCVVNVVLGHHVFVCLKTRQHFELFFCGVGDLVEDGLGGSGGVGGAGDGAADDEHGGSAGDGVGRSGDALLVADVGAGGADAGDDEEGCWAEVRAEEGDLFGGADEAVDSAGGGQPGETEDVVGG
jgi:hypothetical protein